MHLGITSRTRRKPPRMDRTTPTSESFSSSEEFGEENGADDELASVTSSASPSPPSPTYTRRTQIFLRESLVLPLMSMYFVMLLLNTILRDTKDTMLVNSPAGVAAIPILKSWVTIPVSFAFFFAFSRLAHSHLSARSQFIVVLACFAMFYTAFAVVIYPFRKSFSPREWGMGVRERDPHSAWATMVSTIEEWTLGLFYVVSELWSSAVCQLMFWQVANDVMTIRAAKEIYPIIGAMGNAGLVVAGRLLLVFADRRDVDSARAYLRIIENRKPKNISLLASAMEGPMIDVAGQVEVSFKRAMNDMDPAETGWMGTLLGIAILMVLACIFIVICYDDVYRRMRLYHPLVLQRRVDADHRTSPKHGGHTYHRTATSASTAADLEHQSFKPVVATAAALPEEDEVKPTTWEALKMLAKSEPLRLVAVLVASYGVSSSLIEVSWKGQVKRAFSQSGEYSRFMGSFWTWTGLSSMACMVLSSAMLQRLGYRVAVMFTPLAMMFAGGLFFSVSVYVSLITTGTPSLEGGGTDGRLAIAAYAGGIAVLVAKSAKYAVFDATKEMVFIPLDKESRGVGKAAIDVVAYRLSKSGGAVALQLVLVTFGSLDDSGLLPIGILFSVVVLLWIRAAYFTGRLVHTAQRSETIEIHHQHHSVER